MTTRLAKLLAAVWRRMADRLDPPDPPGDDAPAVIEADEHSTGYIHGRRFIRLTKGGRSMLKVLDASASRQLAGWLTDGRATRRRVEPSRN